MAESNLKIKAFRNKETRPLNLDVETILRYAVATQEADRTGQLPKVAKEQFVNKILLEGREDLGTNNYNSNNKQAKNLYEYLVAQGIDPYAARYPAAMLDKSQVAKRLGIPLEEAWNGTGRSGLGRTGAQHAARAEEHKNADKDPRNKELVDMVARAFNDTMTSQEQLMVMNTERLTKALIGLPDEEPLYKQYASMSFTDKALELANKKKYAAYEEVTKTPAGRKALNKIQADEGYSGAGDILSSIANEYKAASGAGSRAYLARAVDPLMAVMIGKDPEAKDFLLQAEKDFGTPPQSAASPDSSEQSMTDRVLNLIRSFAK